LAEAKPLSSLPAQGCLKSASFGSTLRIEFDDQQTPDLSCGGEHPSKLEALIKDANEIVRLCVVRPRGELSK